MAYVCQNTGEKKVKQIVCSKGPKFNISHTDMTMQSMTKRIENSSPQPCNKYGNWGLGKTFWETIFVCYTRPVSNRFPDCDGFIKKPLFCTGPTVVTFCCMEYTSYIDD